VSIGSNMPSPIFIHIVRFGEDIGFLLCCGDPPITAAAA
jgi:hypothetical protein